jgi:hypothetical protein
MFFSECGTSLVEFVNDVQQMSDTLRGFAVELVLVQIMVYDQTALRLIQRTHYLFVKNPEL